MAKKKTKVTVFETIKKWLDQNPKTKVTVFETIKKWLDQNPKTKSALNTFWAGFVAVFILQIKDIDWNNLSSLLEGGAFMGIFLAAVRAGIIAGVSAVGRWLTTLSK